MAATRTTASLLKRVGSLSVPKRETEASRFGREIKDSPDVVATIVRELESAGRQYERRLAALVASAACYSHWIRVHIADSEPSIQRASLRAAVAHPELVPDSAFEDALIDASKAQRLAILSSLHGRQELADRLIPSIRKDWGDVTAVILLPSCSSDVVTRLLPDLLHAVRQWRVLARSHPGILLDTLAKDLSTSGFPAQAWWEAYSTAFAHLLRVAPRSVGVPGRVFDLLERYPVRVPLTLDRTAHHLIRADPKRFMRLLNQQQTYAFAIPRTNLLKVLARNPDCLVEYREYMRQGVASFPSSLPQTLRALPPRDRPAMFEAAISGRGSWLPRHGSFPTEMLDALPNWYTAEVARPLLKDIMKRNDSPIETLRAKAYLPREEVEVDLLKTTRLSQAGDRGMGWECYIKNAARTRDPVQVTTMMEVVVQGLRNEQSPVRADALSALQAIPTKLWDVDALPRLFALAQNVLDARDVSYSEVEALWSIGIEILCLHANSEAYRKAAVDLLRKVNEHPRSCGIELGHALPHGLENELYTALKPLMVADAERDNYSILLGLTHALGRRANNITDLQEDLKCMIAAKDPHNSRGTIPLWLAPKPSRGLRVVEVLKMDPSAVTLDCVQEVLSVERSDLLDGILNRPLPNTQFPPSGRQRIDESTWAFKPTPARAVGRWTPLQQEAYLAQVERLADNDKPSVWTRASAIRRAASVPGSLEMLRRFARSDSVPLAEAAIAGLAKWKEDVPLLVNEYATGDQARVAMYAATSASRLVRPTALLDSIAGVLSNAKAKVTAKKEVIRLAASLLPAQRAAVMLAPLVTSTDTHRDVRAAAVAATADHLLGIEEGWQILETAVSPNTDPTARMSVLRPQPSDLPPSQRQRFATLVSTLAESEDDEVAAAALSQLTHWAQYSKNAPGVIATAFSDMVRPRSVWNAAGNALAAVSKLKLGTAALCSALETLVAHGPEDEDEGEDVSDEDRPAYRRIEYVVTDLQNRKGPEYRSATRVVSALLAQYPDHVRLAAALLLSNVDFRASASDTAALLLEVSLLCSDRPVLASHLAENLQSYTRVTYGADLINLVNGLAEHGSLALGLFAVAIARKEGSNLGWPAKWKAVVRLLRKHEVLDVRDAAAAVEMRTMWLSTP